MATPGGMPSLGVVDRLQKAKIKLTTPKRTTDRRQTLLAGYPQSGAA